MDDSQCPFLFQAFLVPSLSSLRVAFDLAIPIPIGMII